MKSKVLAPYEKLPALAVLLVVTSEILLLALHYKLPPQVPLWYSKPWSLSRLSEPFWLYLIPLSSFLILIGNNFLANKTNQLEKLISKVISLSTVIAVALGFISLLQILLIVRP